MRISDTRLDTDNLLWKVSANDDPEAFRLLFERFYASLCLYAKRYIDDRPAREDIVQDVFFTIWDKRKYILPNTSATNYLVSCVKNNCLNYLRKQGYRQEYQSDLIAHSCAGSQSELYGLKELQDLLAHTLEKLPEAYRLAFVMSRFEDKSLGEIAGIMNVSVRTVERYRTRATEILRDELQDFFPILCMLYTLNQ